MSTSSTVSEHQHAPTAASAAVEEAAEQTLGALLRDRDVSELDGLEGGLLQVVRRGRRQRLESFLEGPLFAVLREVLESPSSSRGMVCLRLRSGHELRCGTLLDGRLALRLLKAPVFDVQLESLEEEGLLPPGIGAELLAGVLGGAGLLTLGSSRAGRQRLIIAIARAAQARAVVFGIGDGLSGLLPVPSGDGGDLVERARDAASLGADLLCALEVSAGELHALVGAGVGIPILASVRAASMDALAAALHGVPIVAAAAQSAVLCNGPDGAPRLLELHTPPREEGADDGGLARSELSSAGDPGLDGPRGASRDALDAALAVPREISALRERPRGAATVVVEDVSTSTLPHIVDVPAGWASDAPDDDPGWELAGASKEAVPAPGSFDAALAAQKRRPSFAPRPPQPHPQTAELKEHGVPGGDPFGGLTFEPPGGPPESEE